MALGEGHPSGTALGVSQGTGLGTPQANVLGVPWGRCAMGTPGHSTRDTLVALGKGHPSGTVLEVPLVAPG